MAGIAEWLASIGLGEYAERFRENAIDLSVVRDLTEQDLKDLGVLLGHRRKMLRAIVELQREVLRTPQAGAKPASTDHAGRRQLTIMFCDLVGSSALSARLDLEDLRAVMGTYHRCIAEVVARNEGVIARYMGDGVLAYFGYPQAHEDDAEQATRAGLALVDAVASLRTEPATELQVRVGIATGMVVVGDLTGEGSAQEQTVIGETPNLAARLQTFANPGTVLISESTHRLTDGHFEFRNLGPVALKGWAEPMPAWQVLGTTEVESRFEAQHKSRLAPPIGRDEEIEMLLRRWQHARRSEGCAVMLTGEPGIGKSHIALALEERLQGEPHITVRQFCSAHHTNSALYPFTRQLERAARFERGDPPAEKFAKLEALLVRADADRVLLPLANLLSLPPSNRYRMPELSPQKRKELTLAAFLSQLTGLAARQPVFVIVEDVHWADPTSLELLTMTLEHLPRLRGLLLITARPEFTPPWPGHAHVTTISLTRLNRRNGAALIERVTAGKTLPEEVMDQILARTDGVPLFVEELTKTVLETGLLNEQDDHYVLNRPLPPMAIPTSLHASLMARLDRLAPVREVAQIGAVVGREFSYELLSTVAGLSKERLEEALAQLVRSELIFCRGEIPQAIYTFKHALVRDAAYSGLLKSRRAALHAAIAGAFEQRFPDLVETQPETLAHHLTEAGLFQKAEAYWLQAGKKAAMRSANLEAIAHLQRGIEASGHLPEGAGKDKLELAFHFALGPCLIATQGPASNKAMATFARARELCERLGDPPEQLQVMFWLTTASVMRGELPVAEETIAALLQLAEARDDLPALLNAMRGQAMIRLFMGQLTGAHEAIGRAYEAFEASSEDDRLAARSAGQDAGVADLALMSWALWLLGQPDTAIVRMDAAIRRADAISHPHSQAYACYYACILHALRGEFLVAQGHAERCIALSEEHGFRQWRLARALRGICVASLDPSPSALGEIGAVLDGYRSAGYQLAITALDVLLCPPLLNSHDYEAALELIEHGLATANRNSERILEAELYRLKARVLVARGGPAVEAEAQALLDRALSTGRSQHARTLELRAATDQAALWIHQGRREEALNFLAPIYASFTEGFETHDLKVAKVLLDGLR
ncbi:MULTISPECIES: adenylate/guanylate cyclase domain-containing protein [Bradyrhizobium]|jgi:class 3 adenylate cyclase/tetratricopeptide (TPR) repeat protein|uniref:Adenylate/guanylate cyclase domain-containing protein n=3 Tax=Bradyrhizobium TaxID=374 RepID=A0A1X3E7E5_9BRAD|nr:adenylate/guanylate cyclase domain-containing protein [Bradyrhizobium canariense]MBM7484460.1 class 3 adenylate cyclase/tetratricopeptide (TPR) repeat protein [Bradyrhizobium canariense]OSI25132.1 adenylate/guanylate cyclase domain-containing protein [Bradyrhizobium canariense]OSI28697.1 adenylate/guanylate cyclase domain-containing protein [Bradyrhizobium canariense]OSI40644.1 adenylate/guanylate cyclase domain-containing protein [Bradyrhizobium canariense]OSI49053.1 adenylate/guanylate cy